MLECSSLTLQGGGSVRMKDGRGISLFEENEAPETHVRRLEEGSGDKYGT